MSVADAVDVSIEILGGLVVDVAPADLPHGVSPDCQDVQFSIGSVKTRPGIVSQYQLVGNPTVNYLKTFETLNEVPRLLSLDSLGVFRKDVAPGGALASIGTVLAGSFCKSCNLFGREYLAFSNGTNGFDIPRQFDDTNFDRISQSGPGQAPAAQDEVVSFNIQSATMFAPINVDAAGLTQNGLLVTLTFGNGYNQFPAYIPNGGGPQIGDKITVAGAGVVGYNGVWTIAAVPNGLTVQYYATTAGLAPSGGGTIQFAYASIVFTVVQTAANNIPTGVNVTVAGAGVAGYNGTWRVVEGWAGLVAGIVVNVAQFALAAAGAAGTVVISGNIAAGKHQVSVIFLTRNRYYTKPAPPNFWVAAGGKRAVVTGIPTGPSNVIARILCFTGVNGGSFYHLGPTGLTIPTSNMVIADNVTTQVTVDFTDGVLELGTLDDPLFNQIELPPVAGIIDYSTRLFTWGEQGNLQSLLCLGFDGGFGGNFPLGWVADPASGAGGASAVASGQGVPFGDAYQITGDGATATRGKITQGAALNYLGNSILQTNTAYTVRARIKVLGAAAGTAHVNLNSVSQGFTSAGISQAFNTLTGSYLAYTGNLTAGLAAIPSDLLLQVYVDGTANAGAIFLVDNIEIYPTNAQFNNSNVRASKGQLNTQGQESYDSQTGLLQVSLNDGQSIRTLFKIRERLYLVKEHSFYVTQDDGVNEPAGSSTGGTPWAVLEVSKKVGTPSINGVGIGEDWVVIAHRTGLYIYHGGEPEKISQEIQPLWDTINWQYGYTISVTVDTRKRRILICAPFGASTVPNKTLVLDYHDVGGADQIASSPPIHLTYTGRKAAFDKSRKWTPWTIAANCIAQIEQANLQTLLYFGSNDGTGNINQLDDSGNVFTDNGAQIPSYYTTAFFVEQPQEQQLQLRTHRKLFQYMTQFVQGSGTMGLTVYLASLSNALALNPQALTNPAIKDLEVGLNQLIERMAIKVSAGGVAGNWFDLQKTTLAVKPDPWALVRGTS